MNKPNNTIYSIGYSSFAFKDFISTLNKYEINALIDVRSVPYSKYKPEYNQDQITKKINDNIQYIFMGKELGARPQDLSVFIDGKVSFDLLAQTNFFNHGINRIKKGLSLGYTPCLLCAEKDPITCHRTILISRILSNQNHQIKHILYDGTIESQNNVEKRLLKKYNLDQTNMFYSRKDRIDLAYRKQENQLTSTPP
jgi:uncharacterized protein (DUF488 family)